MDCLAKRDEAMDTCALRQVPGGHKPKWMLERRPIGKGENGINLVLVTGWILL
jgi:hypothetical protein